MVTRVTEIMGQLTYFQMGFIIKIWKAVENEIIPVLLHHDPIEWAVVLYLRRFLLLAESKGQIYISRHSKSRMCQWSWAIGKAAPLPKLWMFVCVCMQNHKNPLTGYPFLWKGTKVSWWLTDNVLFSELLRKSKKLARILGLLLPLSEMRSWRKEALEVHLVEYYTFFLADDWDVLPLGCFICTFLKLFYCP